jgi:pilus assembly protein CpaE
MRPEMKSIVLISNDPTIASEIGGALRAMPMVTLEERTATLSQMNGAAVTLAVNHDVVIFRTDATPGNDLAAIEALNKALPAASVILALADSSISLADARSLTRAGVDEVLPYPISAQEMQEHVLRWIKPAAAEPQPVFLPVLHQSKALPQGKVIAVAQARGGVGSTTVAVNLADRLLDRHGMIKKIARNRVALVDLDLQFGAVASFLDLEARDTLYQLAIDGVVPDARLLQLSMIDLPSGLSVLTAPSKFAPMEALSSEQVARIIDLLRAEYDYVVVDLPRTLVEWIAPVLARVDCLMLVTDSAVPSIRQARRLIDFYTEENHNLPIEIVINNEKKPLIMKRHHTEAAKVLERPLTHWIPHDPAAAREAIDRGVPLSTAAARSSLAKGINALGRATLSALSAKQLIKNK